MSNSESPSYDDLKDDQSFWIQVTPYLSGLNETADSSYGDGESPLSTFLYYESRVTDIDDDTSFPFDEMRIRVLEVDQEGLDSLSGKYPLGFLKFYEDSISCTLISREKLFSRMVATMGLVTSNNIEFFITLPELASESRNLYPVLNYQYRVCVDNGGVHA